MWVQQHPAGQVIGTCSKCQGQVVQPYSWPNSIPYCTQCGATKKQPHGPVIEMEGGKKP